MSIKIGSNTSSLLVQRNLADTSTSLSKSFEKLSSGQRINRASDDAAGLAIAQRLNTDSRVYAQAMRNVNDGVSYLNIADGALSELSNITCRQLELAEQSANGVYTNTQRKAIAAESNALVKEFNRIVQSTEFNGRKILDSENSGGDLRIQAGFGLDGGVAFGVGDELARTVGTGAFDQKTAYSSPCAAVTLADLDGDGALDLVTAGYVFDVGGGVSVRLNDGNGGFGDPVCFDTTPAGDLGTSLVIAADVDGDGALDLVTWAYTQAVGNQTLVLFNDGHGNFGSTVSYSSYWAHDIAAADINGDGAADLVTAVSGGKATVRLNDGHGNFGAEIAYTTESGASYALAIADINGDGAADLVTAGSGGGSGKATVRLNDGHGNFGNSVSYTTEGTGSNAVFAADINGDGAPDLVTAGMDASFHGQATVRLNDGYGNFGSAVSYTTEGLQSRDLSVADINGDGAADLVTAGQGSLGGKATVRLNDGYGIFGSAVSYTTEGSISIALSIADLNADGALDLVSVQDGEGDGASVRLGFAHDVTTVAALDLFSQESARKTITTLKSQLDRISSERGAIGSSQSRLSVALNTLSTSRENANAAGARITNIDVAQESAELVKSQILQQVGSAILAQANLAPRIAIQLLT